MRAIRSGGAMIRHVYIAGPFTAADSVGITKNVQRVIKAAADVVALGAYPVASHLLGQYMSDGGGQDPDWWYEATREQMLRCDAVLVVGNFRDSVGTMAEIDAAEEAQMPVAYTLDMLKAQILYWWADDERN